MHARRPHPPLSIGCTNGRCIIAHSIYIFTFPFFTHILDGNLETWKQGRKSLCIYLWLGSIYLSARQHRAKLFPWPSLSIYSLATTQHPTADRHYRLREKSRADDQWRWNRCRWGLETSQSPWTRLSPPFGRRLRRRISILTRLLFTTVFFPSFAPALSIRVTSTHALRWFTCRRRNCLGVACGVSLQLAAKPVLLLLGFMHALRLVIFVSAKLVHLLHFLQPFPFLLHVCCCTMADRGGGEAEALRGDGGAAGG
jgi:hypothetical protein